MGSCFRQGGKGKPPDQVQVEIWSDVAHDVTKRKSIPRSQTADTKADDDKVIGAHEEPKESHVGCSKQI